MKVLIAGGAGFIGSTIASCLLDNGHQPVILDNLVTGRREFCEGRPFYEGDIADTAILDRIFDEHPDITAVVHCAALIVVPESVERPVHYYRENVAKTLEFVDHLIGKGVTRLLFSSSASIYQPGEDFTVDENSALTALSPYARTKLIVEQMLSDITAATPIKVLSLRYFNPIGSDPKMRTGLQLRSPSHALGKLIEVYREGKAFPVTGVDYPTRDGSGIRDYVHVWDLAGAHLRALEVFDTLPFENGSLAINLGTGTGTTVLEFVEAFNQVADRAVEVGHAPRRPGDSAGAYTRSSRAADLLGWRAEHSVADGIRDSLNWFAQRERILPDLSAR
ncbi:UDP-glucose 4-epimerase [Actinoplanes campanulatus]|uniref:UDP-glucose 4-epimerase n=1 Tax=Actinoplanes campanulatus TaxID=113559 RepID=A0A7W5AJG6_9ACTN|nr:UDP-glucose 4-epimerase GalE [Actinoplanes campanulatus]MBB3097222.1 UDP-glucose 4-epimerase [Actinoplanes campanulatus]GGN16602.1 UDP-glucose 4-epimerase GalE [Actinoplanes campanulatus]GID37595.1 UDP-glucose 4-epimerase GalE [Actinoplanes campanulatus]